MSYDYIWEGEIEDITANKIIAKHETEGKYTLELDTQAVKHFIHNCHSLSHALERLIASMPEREQPTDRDLMQMRMVAMRTLKGKKISIIID